VVPAASRGVSPIGGASLPPTHRRLAVVDEVFPIELADVEKATDILLQTQGLSARDSLHMAVMQRRRVADTMTFDRGFSDRPGIRIVER